MSINNHNKQKGDTLIEVLFATAVAALLIVTTLIIMNRNLAQIQMGVETTFVRQAMDSQAEVLRYLRDQYMDNPSAELNADGTQTPSKLWKDIVDSGRPGSNAETAATNFGICQPADDGTESGQAVDKAFFINNTSTNEAEGDAADIQNISLNKNLAVAQTYARPGQGIWVEAVSPSFGSSNIRYVDFHIRACWNPPFSGPKATLGTIVRLYYDTP